MFNLHNIGEFFNGVFFGFNCFDVVNLNGFFQSFFRSGQIEFSRNFYVFTNRNGALLCNEGLGFFAEQVVDKFLGCVSFGAVFKDCNRARNYEQFGRIAKLQVSAFFNFSIGNVVNCQCCAKFAGSSIVDNLAGAFTDTAAVSFNVFKEFPL